MRYNAPATLKARRGRNHRRSYLHKSNLLRRIEDGSIEPNNCQRSSRVPYRESGLVQYLISDVRDSTIIGAEPFLR